MKRFLSMFPLPIAVALFALATACADESPQAKSHSGHTHHEHMSMPIDEPVSGQSLHQLEAPWTDQHGDTTRIGDFAGKIVVLAMAYTHCEYACPRIIADMRYIRKQFPGQAQDLAFVLASVDPDRDTVEHLQAFGQTTGLSAQGWRLLWAPDDTVRELAAVLGVQYRRVSASDFAHSNIISVLGPDGEIHYQQKELGVAPDATVAAIRQLQ